MGSDRDRRRSRRARLHRDLLAAGHAARGGDDRARPRVARRRGGVRERAIGMIRLKLKRAYEPAAPDDGVRILIDRRSEEHTSELQSLMRISYAVFCLKKKTQQ